jgi:hypothetical protein
LSDQTVTLTPVERDPFSDLPGGQLGVVPGTEGRSRLEVTNQPQEPYDPLAASAGVAPAGTPRIDQIDWGQPSWTEQAFEQSRRNREAYARGGVPEMFKNTEDTQDLAGGFGGGEIGVAGTFGGKLAKTANQEMLARAMRMTDEGAARARRMVEEGTPHEEVTAHNDNWRKAVWNQTGWFQGPDKKWRFEIPDQRSTVALKNDHTWDDADQVLNHPELYEAYPSLAKHDVMVESGVPEKRQVTGGFTPGKKPGDPGSINVNVGGANPSEQARDVLLHEMQHGIQDIESFSQGGNLYKVPGKRRSATPDFDTYQRAAGEVEARNVQERKDFEHRQVPPWETAGVSEDMQIVGKGRPASRSEQLAYRDDKAFGPAIVHPDEAPPPPSLSDYLSDPSAHLNRFGMPIKGTAFNNAADEAWSKVNALPKGYGPLDLGPTKLASVNVPQAPIQRYAPPRGISPRMQAALNNPAVVEGMINAINRGIQLGAHLWYHTEPIRQAFVQEFGRDNWERPFKLFMDLQAAASPRSDVPTQIRNGSWLYAHALNGRDLPPGGPGNYPYGHLAGKLHRQNFETVQPGGPGWNVIKNPKPPSFSANLQGNLEPGTIDTHAFRLIGMLHALATGDPSFLATSLTELVPRGRQVGKDAAHVLYGERAGTKVDDNGKVFDKYVYRPQQLLQDGRITLDDIIKKYPVFFASKPNNNEYAAAEDLFRNVGRQHFGLPTGDTQAAAWSGGGGMTGLGTAANMTYPELMNQRIMYTSHLRGEEPGKTLRSMVRGHKPLLGIAGAGMVLPHLWSEDWNDPHQ